MTLVCTRVELEEIARELGISFDDLVCRGLELFLEKRRRGEARAERAVFIPFQTKPRQKAFLSVTGAGSWLNITFPCIGLWNDSTISARNKVRLMQPPST
jgi:hypothetical protein